MKTLKLFLTVPKNADSGNFQINIDQYYCYSSKLPWFENGKSLSTVINILDATKFNQKFSEQEDWMVKKGWLNEAKTHFTSDMLK